MDPTEEQWNEEAIEIGEQADVGQDGLSRGGETSNLDSSSTAGRIIDEI